MDTRNIRLRLEYDGTNFHGWQIQPGPRTVQGTIVKKLCVLLGEELSLTGAGRTDAGVHARGQVANFHTRSGLDVESIQRGLNSLLPDDIVVLGAYEVEGNFNARFDATSRVYVYRISKPKRAIGRFYAWYLERDMDLGSMQEASSLLIGTHDFSSFCSSSTDVENRICTVSSSRWRKEGSELTFQIEADRFLHNMVRAIVGTIVEIGRGKMCPCRIKEILKTKDRTVAGPTAPACGLCLIEVKYQ